jgi:hypothetical protein
MSIPQQLTRAEVAQFKVDAARLNRQLHHESGLPALSKLKLYQSLSQAIFSRSYDSMVHCLAQHVSRATFSLFDVITPAHCEVAFGESVAPYAQAAINACQPVEDTTPSWTKDAFVALFNAHTPYKEYPLTLQSNVPRDFTLYRHGALAEFDEGDVFLVEGNPYTVMSVGIMMSDDEPTLSINEGHFVPSSHGAFRVS